MKKYIIVVSLLVLGKSFDLWSTYLAAPDLKGDLNPLILFFNFGWIELNIVLIVLISLASYFYYHILFKHQPPVIKQKNLRFSEYLESMYFKKKQKFIFLSMFLFIPTRNLKHSFFHSVTALIYFLIPFQIYAVINNLLFYAKVNWYVSTISSILTIKTYILLVIILCFSSYILSNFYEYKTKYLTEKHND